MVFKKIIENIFGKKSPEESKEEELQREIDEKLQEKEEEDKIRNLVVHVDEVDTEESTKIEIEGFTENLKKVMVAREPLTKEIYNIGETVTYFSDRTITPEDKEYTTIARKLHEVMKENVKEYAEAYNNNSVENIDRIIIYNIKYQDGEYIVVVRLPHLTMSELVRRKINVKLERAFTPERQVKRNKIRISEDRGKFELRIKQNPPEKLENFCELLYAGYVISTQNPLKEGQNGVIYGKHTEGMEIVHKNNHLNLYIEGDYSDPRLDIRGDKLPITENYRTYLNFLIHQTQIGEPARNYLVIYDSARGLTRQQDQTLLPYKYLRDTLIYETNAMQFVDKLKSLSEGLTEDMLTEGERLYIVINDIEDIKRDLIENEDMYRELEGLITHFTAQEQAIIIGAGRGDNGLVESENVIVRERDKVGIDTEGIKVTYEGTMELETGLKEENRNIHNLVFAKVYGEVTGSETVEEKAIHTILGGYEDRVSEYREDYLMKGKLLDE